jgi:hypothetical protein
MMSYDRSPTFSVSQPLKEMGAGTAVVTLVSALFAETIAGTGAVRNYQATVVRATVTGVRLPRLRRPMQLNMLANFELSRPDGVANGIVTTAPLKPKPVRIITIIIIIIREGKVKALKVTCDYGHTITGIRLLSLTC